MKTEEVLQEIFADHSVKQLAARLGLGVSSVYKWAELCDLNAVSPVERTAMLLELLGLDDRLIQHLCQRAGGVFVRNAPAKEAGPELVPSLFAVELAFMVTLQSLVNLAVTVAAWAMHTRRAVLAKASFSSASTNEAGTNMTGPSAPIKKSVGDIFPLLRIQNPA